MKKLFVLFVLIIAANIVRGQDLIVTTKGDSLKCKVSYEKDDQVFFSMTSKKEQTVHTFISKQNVSSIIYGYFQTEQQKPLQNTNQGSGRLGFDLGGGYKLGKVYESGNNSFDELVKGAKLGFTFGIEGAYFFPKNWGLGLRYNHFRSSGDDGNNNMKFRTSYFGPSFYTRSPLRANPNTVFIFSAGFGYMGEKQDITYNSVNGEIKGQTLGTMLSLGFDFKVSEKSAISIELAYLGGSLSKWKETTNGVTRTVEAPDDNRESLARIELKVGLKLLP